MESLPLCGFVVVLLVLLLAAPVWSVPVVLVAPVAELGFCWSVVVPVAVPVEVCVELVVLVLDCAVVSGLVVGCWLVGVVSIVPAVVPAGFPELVPTGLAVVVLELAVPWSVPVVADDEPVCAMAMPVASTATDVRNASFLIGCSPWVNAGCRGVDC